ncbi:MAG: CRISPR system precrRNA processing endoribonuclease RAMP protein Cas6, partial [Chloroflexota bacterium]
MISYITASFTPTGPPLDGQHITLKGYRGLLYTGVLEPANPRYSAWLHDHPSPKPYSMAPYYTEEGHLAGVRFAAFNEETAHILADGWQYAEYQQLKLTLGKYQSFRAENVQLFPSTDFQTLANVLPERRMAVEFVSPAFYKQGELALPLPLPRNVFMQPLKIWNAFAPSGLTIDREFSDWIERDVGIVHHELRSIEVNYDRRTPLIGFVGRVSFEAHKKAPKSMLSCWQSLGHFLPLCGTGGRTTVGMGMVERIG